MKRCTKCGGLQPLDHFYRAKGTVDGHRGDCKTCFQARAKARYPLVRDQAIERARKWREENIERFRENQRRMRSQPAFKERARADYLQRTYGMSVHDYDSLLASQDGLCAICSQPPKDGYPLHVDHDHATERIRGLLCFKHNNALGDFDDNPDLLWAALRYLGPEAVPRDPELDVRLAELKAGRRAG